MWILLHWLLPHGPVVPVVPLSLADRVTALETRVTTLEKTLPVKP